ncbi:AT-rich interactive domain-containing protein 2 [Arachis stenosperma]|uniref:AT-rich interactive domain-containing protein 2 n=1 Tax=Arachis stenosperma TaxID=217475 RepID=UPI0025AC8B75|nr:AT-rich interactive domain-containing protein 2 [Arachis stenosperma]
MAGWSTWSNGSSLDFNEVEIFDVSNGNDWRNLNDHTDNDDHDKVKTLFDEVFPVYLKESCSRGIVRPMPVLLGDGQAVDLYKLFSLVKEIGGYDFVSRKGLWGYVSKELGLNHLVLASMKLIFVKYLNEFEEWLRKTFKEKSFRNENLGCDWGFKSLPLELEKELRGLLSLNVKDKDDGLVKMESNGIKEYIDLVNHKEDPNVLDTKTRKINTSEDVQHSHVDDDEKACNSVKEYSVTLNASIAENGVGSRKRKREPLSGMLNWVRQVAKHPFVPLQQPLPKPSKWKEYKGNDFFIQLLRAREARLVKPCAQPNNETPSSQKQKMCPDMYEDHVAPRYHSSPRLRCSERLPAHVKSRTCSCCNSGSANGKKLTSSVNTEAENCFLHKTTATVDSSTARTVIEQSANDFQEKQVSVGPLYQADVPEWTGEVCESDSKWLGTRVWPQKHDLDLPSETDLVGRGRQGNCECHFEGSVECVRFHIAERRMKLRRDLGSAFYHWGFDRMGEEISLQWTIEDEKRFKDLMSQSFPSQNKCFWSNKSRYFPDKTRRDLVSYYFNMYLIQLRSYQNRVTPNSVDSDEDEVEFGSFSEGFGMGALKIPGSNFLECSLNKQCTDLD